MSTTIYANAPQTMLSLPECGVPNSKPIMITPSVDAAFAQHPPEEREFLLLIHTSTDPSVLDIPKVQELQKVLQQRITQRRIHSQCQRRYREKHKEAPKNPRATPYAMSKSERRDRSIIELLQKIEQTQSFRGIDLSVTKGLAQILEKHNRKQQKSRGHQLRHRERKKEKTQQINELEAKITKLTMERDQLRHNVLSSQGDEISRKFELVKSFESIIQTDANVCVNYDQVVHFGQANFSGNWIFESDFFPRIPHEQMTANGFMLLLKKLRTFCPQLKKTLLEIQPMQSMEAIAFTDRIQFPLDRSFIEAIFPVLLNDEELVQRMIGKMIVIHRHLRFYFDEEHRVKLFHIESDALAQFANAINDPAMLARLMSKMMPEEGNSLLPSSSTSSEHVIASTAPPAPGPLWTNPQVKRESTGIMSSPVRVETPRQSLDFVLMESA